MIKSDLVDRVMEAADLPKPKATEAVNALFDAMKRELGLEYLYETQQHPVDKTPQLDRWAMDRLPDVDRAAQRSGLIMADIYLATLNEIEQDGLIRHHVMLAALVLEFLDFFPHLLVTFEESGARIEFAAHQCAGNKQLASLFRIDPAVIDTALFNDH